MTTIFVIAHAPLASALREAALHAFAEAAAAIQSFDVPAGADPEQTAAEAVARIDGLGDVDVLVLADVFGATPCNIARSLAERSRVRVLAGVNVPMLWRALNYRQRGVDDVLALAQAGATQGVMQVAPSRPQNQAQKSFAHDPDHRHHQQ